MKNTKNWKMKNKKGDFGNKFFIASWCIKFLDLYVGITQELKLISSWIIFIACLGYFGVLRIEIFMYYPHCTDYEIVSETLPCVWDSGWLSHFKWVTLNMNWQNLLDLSSKVFPHYIQTKYLMFFLGVYLTQVIKHAGSSRPNVFSKLT